MPPAHVARQVARLSAVLRLNHTTVTEAVTDSLTSFVADPGASRRGTTAHQADLRGPPPVALGAAGHDSPHSTRHACGCVTTSSPALPRSKPASADQLRLTSKRAPG